jgi:hypothetical protein
LSSSLPHLAAAILLYFTITLKSQKRAGGSWLLLLHLELSLKGAAELSATNRRRMQQMGSDIFRSCPNDFPLVPTAAAAAAAADGLHKSYEYKKTKKCSLSI